MNDTSIEFIPKKQRQMNPSMEDTMDGVEQQQDTENVSKCGQAELKKKAGRKRLLPSRLQITDNQRSWHEMEIEQLKAARKNIPVFKSSLEWHKVVVDAAEKEPHHPIPKVPPLCVPVPPRTPRRIATHDTMDGVEQQQDTENVSKCGQAELKKKAGGKRLLTSRLQITDNQRSWHEMEIEQLKAARKNIPVFKSSLEWHKVVVDAAEKEPHHPIPKVPPLCASKQLPKNTGFPSISKPNCIPVPPCTPRRIATHDTMDGVEQQQDTENVSKCGQAELKKKAGGKRLLPSRLQINDNQRSWQEMEIEQLKADCKNIPVFKSYVESHKVVADAAKKEPHHPIPKLPPLCVPVPPRTPRRIATQVTTVPRRCAKKIAAKK